MKFYTFIFTLLFNTSVFACIDLSGSYKTLEGARYSLAQKGCESMDMTDESRVFTINFNQVDQMIYDFDISAEDQVIGKHKVYIKSTVTDSKWLYDERAVNTFTDGRVEERLSKSEVFLNEKRNLVTIVYRDSGEIEKYEDIKE